MTTLIERAAARKQNLLTIEDRIRARSAALRAQADAIRIDAEKQLTALHTAADELDALLAPPTEN